jgi:nucleoside-diphosphate-sugar epimerase
MSPTATTSTDGNGRLIIAITGANGMVGQGVTEKAINDGHRVIALDIGPDSFRANSNPTIHTEAKPKSEGEGENGEKEEGKYKYYQLDATDYEAYYKIIKEEGCTAIIHLAATFNKFGEDGELVSNVPSHVCSSPPHPPLTPSP